jgi:glycosyltransferase involved in cell wall biosynthesis
VQYPTAGFGKSLTPQLLSLLRRFVLTVHELEGRHLLRRLSFYPFWIRTQHVVFTCEFNRKYALRWAPWLRKMSSVIPLSSNIPAPLNGRNGRALREVVHFGLVRPKRGIEEVLEFANLAAEQRSALTVRMVGGLPSQHAVYLAGVQKASLGLPITWDLDLSAEAVAERLGRATVAYIPFPDGASERNTSLLAALAHGLPVITTKGRSTPPGLEGAVCFCSTPAEAVGAARALLDSPLQREAMAARGRQYVAEFRWESIAQSHIALYQQLTAAHANRH